MFQQHNATVLPFRDSALRRPIDVVAWTKTYELRTTASTDAPDNVVPLARFARTTRRGGSRTWLAGPPEGEAA